jgi:hypothetical protein
MGPSIKQTIAGEERVLYTLPPTVSPHVESVLYFTIPKAGTVLLSKFMGELAYGMGLPCIFVEGELFKLGIRRENAPASTENVFLDKGYCYGAAEMPTAYAIPILGRAKTILMVRDPRDMLVSLYYSVRYSHIAPGDAGKILNEWRSDAERHSVDEYALLAAFDYAERMRSYRDLSASPLTKVFRYEDVIYNKAEWVADICNHFGWDVPRERQREIAASGDVFPDKENCEKHVRQVHPGNYKIKLKPKTISTLDDILAADMALFGYEPDAKTANGFAS